MRFFTRLVFQNISLCGVEGIVDTHACKDRYMHIYLQKICRYLRKIGRSVSTHCIPNQSVWFVDDVGNAAAFLASPLAASITGSIVYVDNGLHAMGLATDSPAIAGATATTPTKASVRA